MTPWWGGEREKRVHMPKASSRESTRNRFWKFAYVESYDWMACKQLVRGLTVSSFFSTINGDARYGEDRKLRVIPQ